MGQQKGNPTPSYQNQAYEVLRPNTNARANRDMGTKPVMINDTTTLSEVVDLTFNTDSAALSLSSSLHDGSKDVVFNTVGATSNGLGQNFKVGDDVWLGDINVSNTMVISGIQDPTTAILQFGSGSQPSIAHIAVGAPFPIVGSALAITGSLLIGHTGHLYIFNGGASNGGWATVI
jgi:hypothetical protein